MFQTSFTTLGLTRQLVSSQLNTFTYRRPLCNPKYTDEFMFPITKYFISIYYISITVNIYIETKC